MAGQIHAAIQKIIVTRGRGNRVIENGTKTKLLLKGINASKWTSMSPDDTDLHAISAELEASLPGNPTFILYFHSTSFDANLVAASLAGIFPGVPALGCSTSGEIVTGKLLDKLVPDAGQSAAAKAKLAQLAMQGQLDEFKGVLAADAAQVEVNKIEAANPSLFVSGWRPVIGWVCAVALALYYVPRFVLGMAFWCKLAWVAQGVLPPLPDMGIADILGLVASLLGMSAIRAKEKLANVARSL